MTSRRFPFDCRTTKALLTKLRSVAGRHAPVAVHLATSARNQSRSDACTRETPWWKGGGGPVDHGTLTPSAIHRKTCLGAPMRRQAPIRLRSCEESVQPRRSAACTAAACFAAWDAAAVGGESSADVSARRAVEGDAAFASPLERRSSSEPPPRLCV